MWFEGRWIHVCVCACICTQTCVCASTCTEYELTMHSVALWAQGVFEIKQTDVHVYIHSYILVDTLTS